MSAAYSADGGYLLICLLLEFFRGAGEVIFEAVGLGARVHFYGVSAPGADPAVARVIKEVDSQPDTTFWACVVPLHLEPNHKRFTVRSYRRAD